MRKFPDEWLFVVEPQICENTCQLLSGIVHVYSSSRDIVHKTSKEFFGNATIKFTGEYTNKQQRHSLISYSLKDSK